MLHRRRPPPAALKRPVSRPCLCQHGAVRYPSPSRQTLLRGGIIRRLCNSADSLHKSSLRPFPSPSAPPSAQINDQKVSNICCSHHLSGCGAQSSGSSSRDLKSAGVRGNVRGRKSTGIALARGDWWVLNIKGMRSLSAADGSLLFTCVQKQMAWTYLMAGDGRTAAGSCPFGLVCVRAFALARPRPLLPVSPPHPRSLSLQPAWQTGGQATPLRPAGCERRGQVAR